MNPFIFCLGYEPFSLLGFAPSEWVALFDRGIMFAISVLLVLVLARYASIRLSDYDATLKIKRKKMIYGDERDVKLLEHRFFTAMDFYLSTRIPILPIKEPGRAKIFRDFLSSKFEVMRDNMEALIRKNDLVQMPQMEFEALIMEYLNEAITDYEKAARGAGIPDIVLEKFALWHRSSIEQTSNFLLRVSQSPWYGSNTQKVVAILDYLTTVMHATLLDAQYTLSRLNGELDGLTYKGLTVQPYKHYHAHESDSGTHPALTFTDESSEPPMCPVHLGSVPELPPCHDCERRKAWELKTGARHE